MSKEGTPELTKSWVFVDPEKKNDEDDKQPKDTCGVKEVTENETHPDSDTDSISVISESGCSYKTDEEELSPATTLEAEEKVEEVDVGKSEVEEKETEKQPEDEKGAEIINPQSPESIDENRGAEKLLYFATSAVCAIILLGLSVAVQQYLQGASDVNTLDSDQQFVFPQVQTVKNEENSRKLNLKRKNHLKLGELENKIAKLQEDNEYHDKIASPVRDNDLREDGNLKSNYKLNKNKSPAPKCNKENCDVSEKYQHEKIHSDGNDKNKETRPDETYDKKIKELKVKEDYLREKEKFLIEKEHSLLKKEIKLKKEKGHYVKNKHDKKPYHRKEDNDRTDSAEEEGRGRYKNKENNPKINKKYKKEEKKQFSAQKRYKFSDEHDKKRNISGQWYISLHEARDNMRQKKRAGFKRNKAHWYFQWMVDRARLRVK